MHSVCVLSQLLVSVLFTVYCVVPTNAENFNYTCLCAFSSYSMQSYSYECTIESCFYLHRQNNSMAIISWLDYIKCNLLYGCVEPRSNGYHKEGSKLKTVRDQCIHVGI